jgi:iron(III) transport system substrate-binding protein
LRRLAALLLLIPVLAAACGGNDGEAEGADTAQDAGTLTVYSGREEELVAPLFELFEDETGIHVEVRYGDSAELAATIAEEGDQTPADVFFAQDPGSLGSLGEEGLLAELPANTVERVPERFRDPDGRWVGTSGRVRVIAYNTEALTDEQVPDSVFELTDSSWEGRIGFPPTNASFQAFVTAMRISEGEERTREWLEDADAPVENHFLAPGDPGALVSVAGAGVLAPTDDRESAERFVEFLLSHEGQRFYAERAEEAEYPLVAGIEPREGLPPLSELEGPDVRLDAFGGELEETLELLNEVGFTS